MKRQAQGGDDLKIEKRHKRIVAYALVCRDQRVHTYRATLHQLIALAEERGQPWLIVPN
jgi:hypothetical protein